MATYLEQRWQSGRRTAGDRHAQRSTLHAPRAYGGLYETPRNTGEQDFYRPRPFGTFNLRQMLSAWNRQELVEFSRQLFCHLGNFGSAVKQKTAYAVGDAWLPQYVGKNKAWGKAAEQWLHQVWMPQCDWRGQFDFQTMLHLSGMAWDVDGDDADLMAIDEQGFPRLLKLSTDRIGSAGEDTIKDPLSPFDGAKIDDGQITDDQGRLLGYRILTEQALASAYMPNDDYMDVAAANIHLGFEPEWGCQGRGIPAPARAIMDGFDLEDIDRFIKRGIKQETAIGLLHNSEAAQPEPGSELEGIPRDDDPNTAKDGVAIRKLYGGEMWYLRAGLGETITGVNTGRPHMQTIAQLERLERRMFAAIGWFFELLDPSRVGGASVRLIQDQARTSIASKQRALKRRAKREILFALGQAIAKRWLPPNPDQFDWMLWQFNLPPQLTVDQGYDEQADQNNFVLGTTTLAAICQKKGRWWEDTRQQRLEENADLVDKARELMNRANAGAKAPEEKIELREAIMLMQASPNVPENLRAAQDRDANKAVEIEK